MKKSLFVILIFSLISVSAAQTLFKKNYTLQGENGPFAGRLDGNGIVDLLAKDSLIWAASGYGLNMSSDQGKTWKTFYSRDYKAKGGVSAMGYMDDSTLWIATAFDTSVISDDLPAGGGLSYTRDGGETWTYIPQPVDPRDVEDYAPTTTVVQNLTYDIAFVDSTIWIASFGGGLRRTDDMGQTWQVVTTDGLPFSSAAYLNHRAFSLLNVKGSDTLWVGTAAGISMTPDNGQNWHRFTFDADSANTISGNFVVAFAYQPQTHTLWAATIQAEDTAETRGVSITSDGGENWQRLFLEEEMFTHNFAVGGAKVYVVSDKGAFIYEKDSGIEKIESIRDSRTGEEILRDDFYSAAVQNIYGQSRLWLGSTDGLATTNDGGKTWQVNQSFVSTTYREKPAVYPSPSPFSPSRHIKMRFRFDVAQTGDAEIKIYDFGMNHIITLDERQNFYDQSTADRSIRWDGKTSSGRTVATGVYFFRAEIVGKVTWGKFVIIN